MVRIHPSPPIKAKGSLAFIFLYTSILLFLSAFVNFFHKLIFKKK
ncbi:hypothetical protein X925_04980 [Petrotoga sp. 9T1HF07.CasAA.8.2]|nr:hypothetical protein X925_04980 [Petrotoga sp. 9T1HF07.CasAA.8.2]